MVKVVKGQKVKLRNKKLSDAHNDYTWQSNAELAYLDAIIPLNISFPQYLLSYATELRRSWPGRIQFAIDTLHGKHIGNCVFYDINEAKGEAEIGIMIGNSAYWNQGYGTDAVNTLLEHIFTQTRLNRLYLKTLESNCRAQRCFQKCGFKAYGKLSRDGFSFLLMELYRSEWQKSQLAKPGDQNNHDH